MRTNTIRTLGLCLVASLALCLTQGLRAQCATLPTTVSTQAALVAFAQANASCDTLRMNLTISGGLVSDLSPLSFLKAFHGKLSIINTPVPNLQGLHHLDTIGALEITSNNLLVNLQGLDMLRALGELKVTSNTNLEDFVGLQSLSTIKGSLTISQNPKLRDFTGMEGLYGFQDFEVSQNESLLSFTGLNNCQNIGKIRITNNAKLENLNGFDRLENIWNGLWVKRCNQLQTLGNFPLLRGIKGSGLVVDSNQVLLSLGSFPLLDTVQNLISIQVNANLTDLGDMPSLKRITGELTISRNDTLAQIVGWPNLNSVGSSISISYHKNLQEISGFGSLQKVGGFYVSYNSILKYIKDFNQLEQQTDILGFQILNNPKLLSVIGFQAMKSLNNFGISTNDSLTEIRGFDLVQNIQRSFNISNNKSLEIIQAFAALKTSGDFSIYANAKLKRFEGITLLENITITPATFSSYSGSLNIIDNPELEYLTDFSSLKSVYQGITLRANKLSECNPNFANLTSTLGITIAQNTELLQISGGQNHNNFVSITSNAKLQSINQLTAWSSLKITDNPELKTIDAFHNGLHISNISIKNNPKLTTFTGFTNLKGAETVEFQSLPLLTQIPIINDSNILKITIRACHTIQNLDCFSSLTHTRYVTIDSCDGLKNISGLGNVRTNASGFYVWPTPNFTISNCGILAFEGLDSLETVENLSITGNPNLAVISTLPKLKRLIGLTRISNNPQLTTIQQLDSIRILEFSLELANNPLLQNLELLKKVKQIWIGLTVENCGIVDFSALDSLDYLGSFLLKNNPYLSSLAGLDKLQLTKSLKIEQNEKLTDISAPQYLRVDGPISITKNTLLQNCAVFPVCERIATKITDVFLHENGTDCSEVAAVAFQCDNTLNASSGKLYLDENCDSIYDPTKDYLIPNKVIIDHTTLLPISLSQANGTYNLISQPSQSLTFRPKLDTTFYHSVPTVRSISATTLPTLTTSLDFAVCLDSTYHDLEVFATTIGAPRPGFTFGIKVCIVNKGPWPEENVVLTLDLDDVNFPFITIVDAAGAQVNQDVFTWNIGQLGAFESQCFTIQLKLSPSIAIGQQLLAVVSSNYSNYPLDETLANNNIRWLRAVVGSYDPNVKLVDRKTIPYQGHQDESTLDYTIYFQNTGTAPAIFIEVHDTLSVKHDLRTFEMVDASHAYTVSFPDANVIKWRFDDINLPDSTSSPLGSIGFVRFRLAAQEGLPLYDEAKNAVAIYFDYNDPIFTDTAVTVVCPKMQLQTLAYDAKCNKNNGIALAQTAPGNFTFLWSNGSTTNKISGLAPGLYTVTVFSDTAACTETAVVEIKKIPAPELALIGLDHIKCFGELTGSLAVHSQTGVMPFKYLWNTGDTTALIDGIGAGVYSVVISDKNNCRDTLSQLEILQPALLSITGLVNAQTNLTMPNGSIIAEPIGGTPPYSFAWSNGANSPQIDSLSSGIYSVTIIDSLNCVASNQFEILLTVGLHQVVTLPLRVHPNPTNAWLHVQMPDDIHCSQGLQIKILDQTGKTHIATHLQGLQKLTSIAVADLTAGAYRVILQCNDPFVSYETQLLIVR